MRASRKNKTEENDIIEVAFDHLYFPNLGLSVHLTEHSTDQQYPQAGLGFVRLF